MSEQDDKPQFLVVGRTGGVSRHIVEIQPKPDVPAVPEATTPEPIFMDVLARSRALEAQAGKRNLSAEEQDELTNTRRLIQVIVDEVEESGGFVDLQDDIDVYRTEAQDLRQLSLQNRLQVEERRIFLAELRGARRVAREITGNEPAGERYTGVREYWMIGQLTNISGLVGNLEVIDQAPVTPAPETVPDSPDLDLTELINAITNGNQTVAETLDIIAQQNQMQVDALRGVDPLVEKAQWVDMEYRQEFYTRFDPRSEPKFLQIANVGERRVWEARWELARAAFYKKATASFPDKLKESQDLALLSKKEMKLLYEVPGVREMLHGYATAIVDGDPVRLRDGREISFWEIKDDDDFEQFRGALRAAHLNDRDFRRGVRNNDELNLRMKEADTVAWNLVWVTNLVESADSRYSYSGARHADLPSAVCSDEYRAMMHPQEKFESKCVSGGSGHHWGAFGKWGAVQVQGIKSKVPPNTDIVFEPARKNEYWRATLRDNVVTIKAPEVYPVTTVESFLESTKAQNEDGDNRTLLEYILDDEEIPWDSVAADAWGIYIFGKFNKGVQFAEYYNPGKELKEGDERAFTYPLKELLSRLTPDKTLSKIGARGYMTYQTEHNLRVLPVYAATGGVKDPSVSEITLNMNYMTKNVMRQRLHDSRMGDYLGKKEKLELD